MICKKNLLFLLIYLAVILTVLPLQIWAANEYAQKVPDLSVENVENLLRERSKLSGQRIAETSSAFDLPLTFNRRVSFWISYFQDRGKIWFREWLEKSSAYLPFVQKELKANGMPQDLAFMVMIESGFNVNATSSADAVGPWQFIKSTGERYGLKVHWWVDERRDFKKATLAAIRYLRALRREFGSWYLVAASYNMGEAGLRRQIRKHGTRDFWKLSRLEALPKETIDYVPKILAAMVIAKSPGLYGFRDLTVHETYDYDIISVPGGTNLINLADYLGVTHKYMKDLNAELLLGYVPRQIAKYFIRIPKGSLENVASYTSQLTK